MDMQTVNKGDITIIQISGDLDINSHLDFYDYFIPQLKKSVKIIGINFEKVDTIDSSGIGILVRCEGEVKKSDKEMILFGMNDKILKNFKLVRLTNFFNIKTQNEFQKNYTY
jgi:anti-anti-sigma factor